MKSIRPFLFMILALLIGWAIGLYATQHYYEQWIGRYQTRHAFDGVNDRLIVLNPLRAGDTNGAAELLESQLDGQLLMLGTLMQNVSASELQPRQLQLLTQLRNYRAAHPRQTSQPEIDRAVAGVLSATNSDHQP